MATRYIHFKSTPLATVKTKIKDYLVEMGYSLDIGKYLIGEKSAITVDGTDISTRRIDFTTTAVGGFLVEVDTNIVKKIKNVFTQYLIDHPAVADKVELLTHEEAIEMVPRLDIS